MERKIVQPLLLVVGRVGARDPASSAAVGTENGSAAGSGPAAVGVVAT